MDKEYIKEKAVEAYPHEDTLAFYQRSAFERGYTMSEEEKAAAVRDLKDWLRSKHTPRPLTIGSITGKINELFK